MIPTLLLRYWWVIALAALSAAVGIQTKRLHSAQAEIVAVQARFDTFVGQTKALGEQAQAAAKQKESDYAHQITVAVTTRDAALAKLRLSAADTGRSSVPLTPPATQGSDRQCFDPPALAAAVERYRTAVRGLVESGDEAIIDGRALIDAWPK